MWGLNTLWSRPKPLGSTHCLSALLPKDFPGRILSLCSNWYNVVHLVSLHAFISPAFYWDTRHLDAHAVPPDSTGPRPHGAQSNGTKAMICLLIKPKQQNQEPTEGWFNKLWCIHTMKRSVATYKCWRQNMPGTHVKLKKQQPWILACHKRTHSMSSRQLGEIVFQWPLNQNRATPGNYLFYLETNHVVGWTWEMRHRAEQTPVWKDHSLGKPRARKRGHSASQSAGEPCVPFSSIL